MRGITSERAERLLQKAWDRGDRDIRVATLWSQAILFRPVGGSSRSAKIGEFVALFPQDGMLACLHALGLGLDNRMRPAAAELERARALGVQPESFLPRDVVRKIEEEGTPT